MKSMAVIQAPSILGLKPTGVEDLPRTLIAAGLLEGLKTTDGGTVIPPAYDAKRDKQTNILNPSGLRDYSIKLADVVQGQVQKGEFPLVLGGDCSILLGCTLGLRRLGTYGLFFIDGHADFYQPEASPTGEAADMELGFVTGRGPDIVTDIEGQRPLVQDEHVVAFGFRDTAEQKEYGSRDIAATPIHTLPLEIITKQGIQSSAKGALAKLQANGAEKFWLHLDADVLDDKIMPAVDYRLPGGLNHAQLTEALSTILGSGRAIGISVSIYNPKLDTDGSAAKGLVNILRQSLQTLEN